MLPVKLIEENKCQEMFGARLSSTFDAAVMYRFIVYEFAIAAFEMQSRAQE